MKDPSKVTTQAPFLAPYPLQKTKSIQPKTWPPNTPGAPLAGEQVPGERWGLQPALDPGCVAAADAPRPLRVENGVTPAPGAGEGRVRSCRPRAQHSGCAAPRGPDPAPRPPPFTHSFAHSSVRAWPRAFTLRVFPPAASAASGRRCGAVCTSGRLSSLRGVVRGPRLCP